MVHRDDVACGDGVDADHVLSSDPDCGPLVKGRGTNVVESDIVMPRAVETLFPTAGESVISLSEEYEEMARTVTPHPDGPQQVLLIAPMSHPIGNRITLKALLAGDTVLLHEHAPETVPSAAH
ncbi:hypothetical protein GKO32_36115 [Amycolatopsis sp. RM579]|uniref:Uncharacterized protein n=1 Tax=Amycolatopsis pithecellobii TaxID=664692 RepID=A0A6N7ZC91_9PSEU|nr:hypothetical protein [Amycolatopsis pithecellobii]